MTLKILEEKNNALFRRKEIRASLESETTPSRSHVLELLSKKFEIPKENIKIRGIKGSFGVKNFSIEANIYHSKEEKETVELKKKKETHPSVAELKETRPSDAELKKEAAVQNA